MTNQTLSVQLFLLPDPHGAVGRAPWKTVPPTTLVAFLSKTSVLSVSVVMPHQLKANSTQIGHVIHLFIDLIKHTVRVETIFMNIVTLFYCFTVLLFHCYTVIFFDYENYALYIKS